MEFWEIQSSIQVIDMAIKQSIEKLNTVKKQKIHYHSGQLQEDKVNSVWNLSFIVTFLESNYIYMSDVFQCMWQYNLEVIRFSDSIVDTINQESSNKRGLTSYGYARSDMNGGSPLYYKASEIVYIDNSKYNGGSSVQDCISLKNFLLKNILKVICDNNLKIMEEALSYMSQAYNRLNELSIPSNYSNEFSDVMRELEIIGINKNGNTGYLNNAIKYLQSLDESFFITDLSLYSINSYDGSAYMGSDCGDCTVLFQTYNGIENLYDIISSSSESIISYNENLYDQVSKYDNYDNAVNLKYYKNRLYEMKDKVTNCKKSVGELLNSLNVTITKLNEWNVISQESNNIKLNDTSIDDLANQVINGDWGNGQARKTALEEAGYNYREIQDRVNAILLGTGAVVTNSVTNSAVSNITNNNSSDSNPGGNVQYRVDDTSNTVLDDKNKEYLDALRKAEADGEAKLKKLKEEYANKYKQLTDEQTKKIEQLKKEQEDALRKLKEEQQKKLQEMKQQLKDKEAEMAKIKAEQAAALEKLKKEQAEALKKQLEEQAKKLDALKDKHAQEIEKIKQETADAIAKIKNEQKSTNTITNGSSNNGNIPLGNKPSSNGSNSGTTVADSSNTNSSSTNNDSIVISDNNSNSVSDKPERPSYTTITTNPVTKTNSKSSSAGVVGTILGIGALGAAGAVGARYIKKKKENEIYDDNENYFSNDEEFSQSTEKDTNESTPRYEAGSVNGLVLDDDSDINITNTKSISNDTLDFE